MALSDRKIIKEALKDTLDIKDLAVETAKKLMIEEITPEIRKLVEGKLNLAEDVDRLRRGESEFEEGKKITGEKDMKGKDKEMTDESLSAMFPGLSEMEDEGDLDKMPEAAEEDEPAMAEAEETDMDEEIEISEEELKKAYESLMATDAALAEASVNWKPSVTGGFKDTYPNSEWATEDGPPKDTGLMDKGADGKGWEETKPPKAQDYTVKEAIERGLAENKELRRYVSYLEGKIQESVNLIKKLKVQVESTNLFNSKVMQVNEILHKHGRSLTMEQKKMVVERIDAGTTVKEVKMVGEALKASLSSTASQVNEGVRRNKPNAQKVTRSGSPDPKVLRESVDRSAAENQYARINELAGLSKKLK